MKEERNIITMDGQGNISLPSDIGATAPPSTDRKGKNKVEVWASRRQGQPPPKGRRHAAGYLRRKYHNLLGNFPSRNTPYR